MKKRPVRIDGDVAYVPLTKGYEAMIDASDVELVDSFNWQALVGSHAVYAQRIDRSGSKKKTIRMHRVISGAGHGLEVDHINGNGLDNRRSNLRVATHQQNLQNQRISKTNNTGFKGVSWHKTARKWRARITVSGKETHLGFFPSLEAAHAAYAIASSRMHGDFGRVV